MSMNTVPERLAALREAMKANGVDVYLIPVGDPHASEYMPDHYTALTYFSGFHGENSNFVVTMTESAVWAEGRYFVQAEKEIAGTEIQLMRMGEPGVPTAEQYCGKVLPEGGKLGLCGLTASCGLVRSLQKELDDLLSRKKRLYDENNISSLTQEQATNAQRIIIQEDRLLHAETQLDALQKKYDDLEVQLQTTPKIVELYSEQNISSDRKLADLKLELSSLRQRYTDNNPIVEKQKTLIKALEDSIRENKADDGKVKVVNGRNAEYINLSNEQHKIKAERTALKSTIATYTETLAKLKERRDKLDLLAPSLNLLEDQINQKRNLLLKQEALTKELQLFLDRSFTDVTIQETATVPTDPLPRRRPLFFLLGLFLGAVLSGGFVLGKEFINLSVRSKVDIEDALHIPALGIIPHFDHHCRADFYSALQGAVNQAEELLRGVEKTPAIIAIAPALQEDLSTNILNEFCEILKVKRDASYRIIRVAPEEQTSSSARYLVNDFLYGFTDTLPEPGKDQVLYFKLDDLAFISPPEEERIGQLRNTLQQFDLVIWELFEFELHRQLYSEICKSADLTVIPMRYGRTSKWQIYQTLLQLNTCKVQRIAGLLYDVENKIYRKVSL